jgi:PIN domain nuclease of toxin-antitoxin system
MLLLDTHVIVWLSEGLENLPETSRDLIDRAAREVGLAVSPISFWEIAMLHFKQRLTLSLPVQQWRELVLENPAINEVPLTGDVAIESVLLPGTFHNDPADRMLVATARLNSWHLATRDTGILAYSAAGHVNSTRV